MLSNQHVINPKNWILVKTLIKNEKSLIYNILPIIDKNSSEEYQTFLSNKKWILKVTDDPYEIHIIEYLKMYDNELCIKIDKTSLFRDDKTKINWYVMEKYDNNIYADIKFAKKNLMKLGDYMCKFLRWLHIENHNIHGDIKANNIVFDNSNKDYPFKIIDYESIRPPSKKLLCDESHYENCYFYYLGCDYNKPYYSYRMDLEAFGRILFSLEVSDDYYQLSEWQTEAIKCYDLKMYNSFFRLALLKQAENKEAELEYSIHKNTILKYFNIIRNQDWFDEPNVEVYDELEKLFKNTQSMF